MDKEKDREEAKELYQLLNERLSKEIDEFYKLHEVFFVVLGALLGIKLVKGDEASWPILLACSLVSLVWFFAIGSTAVWKRFWTKRLQDVEVYLKTNEGSIENLYPWSQVGKELRKISFSFKKPSSFWPTLSPKSVAFLFMSLSLLLFVYFGVAALYDGFFKDKKEESSNPENLASDNQATTSTLQIKILP